MHLQVVISRISVENRTALGCFMATTESWVKEFRKAIKSEIGSGLLIQVIEKQNKVLTKIVYRFSTC